MNASWKEIACKWKKDERTWMHIGMKMKGTWKEMDAQWKEDACKWKEDEGKTENACKSMQHERNMKCCRNTTCLGMDFGFMLDLEYADFTKPWKAIGPLPKSDNHNNSNYSDVKNFDGSSYINWMEGIVVDPTCHCLTFVSRVNELVGHGCSSIGTLRIQTRGWINQWIEYWLVVSNIFCFPLYGMSSFPFFRTPSFFKMVF